MHNNTVVIKLSKIKIGLIMMGSVIFVAGGLWMWNRAYQQDHLYHQHSPALIRIVSVAAIIFFGMCGIYSLVKLFDNKPGLIISPEGILDNTNMVGGHFIKWSEIKDYSVLKIKRTSFLLIFVDHPGRFINDATGIRKIFLRLNMWQYKTPLSISVNTLQCNFDELKSAILEGMKNAALASRAAK